MKILIIGGTNFIGPSVVRQELGYKEIVPLDEALRQTIDWQRTHSLQEPQPFAVPWLLDYAIEDAILSKFR
ncbi:MAG: hypothetical protein V7K41_13840 [Nostoc sp.]|uniref:hypothetical protein n=1 Tax=Nostoc sp. TaxID=1180 RepID=UPI002FFB2E7E